jgi:murein L,D-transpeptidase YafK
MGHKERSLVLSAMRCIAVAWALFAGAASAHAYQKADLVLVKKSESRLYLMNGGESFAAFDVLFGPNPLGHKQREGDGRTPEGRYLLDQKRARSRFYKALHISYPNAADRARARRLGVDPGGEIMVHGQPNKAGSDGFSAQDARWTQGCIALANDDMDVLWRAVEAGVPIEIQP